MRRLWHALGASAVLAGGLGLGGLGLGVSEAGAAGIVTHSWMATDAIALVGDPDLRALLDTHREQVRAGAEFPDGGYATVRLGTPGGDYGEEAHWQRFVDAYTAQIRDDPTCGDLTDPDGPCAPTVAHLMGVAGHGMGDQVWDWLFEPNGPAFEESYLPADFAPFVGPGGLELQLDLVAIMRHGRSTAPTPALPDAAKIDAAFDAVGRSDIAATAFPVGEQFLEIERAVEAMWAPRHIDALERAMPWTSQHLTSAAGGVAFGARAIAGYYDTIWENLHGRSVRTRIAAMAPFPGQRNVPATGWTGTFAPGSNPGNSGGLTRIAIALSSALPYNARSGQGPVASELAADTMRLRDTVTGALVPPRAGYPRIVPYNPEAGEHMVAFQPATDLQPCRWYRVEVTRALVDAQLRPVERAKWRFRTSGCVNGSRSNEISGTVTCAAKGAFKLHPQPRTAGALMTLTNCAGGQDGALAPGASLPVASGVGGLYVDLAGPSCRDLTEPSTEPTVHGIFAWYDAHGREVGRSTVDAQPLDLRGGIATVSMDQGAFAGHALSLRVAPHPDVCAVSPPPPLLEFTGGRVTTWPR